MEIYLPDKDLTLDFPDDMTEDQMRDAINRNFYPEKLSSQPAAPAAPELPAPAAPHGANFVLPKVKAPVSMDLGGTVPAAPVLPGVTDGDVVPDVMAPPSTDTLDPGYWDLGTIAAGTQKGIAGLDTRKATRADIETARAFRQSNDPTRRPNLLELGMAALSDPSVLDIQDEAKQARAAAEVEAYNSASRAQALRQNAEWWDPGEYYVPTEGIGKVLHDLAVNAPYTLKNMPLAAAATLAAGPYGAFTGSIPGALSEGLDEGAEVYRRLIEKGVDPDEAYKRYLSHADKVALGLMLSDPLQNMATFGLGKLFPNAGVVARTLGGLLFDMGAEGAEEVLEGVAANKAVGDPNDWNELGYEGLLGALSGGLFGGGGMAANAIANAMAKENTSAATEIGVAPETSAPVAEVLEELRKEDDARQALPRKERADLMRWAQGETGRMAEEAQFAEDGTPENPLGETDLARYQEIRDAMKRKDYAALLAMRGEAEAQPNLSQPLPSEPDVMRGDTASKTVEAPVNSEVNRGIDLPEGYELESGKPLSEAAPEEFVLRHGDRAWGHVTEELSGGRDDVPIGEVRVQAGDKEWGLTHAKVHEHRAQKMGFRTMEDFIANGLENGNSIIPIGDTKHFLVARVEGNKVHPSAVIRWNPRDAFYSLTTSFPATDQDIRRQENKSRSLKSGPSAPEPGPASLASAAPISTPEEGSDWRYEDRDLDPTLPSSGKSVKPFSFLGYKDVNPSRYSWGDAKLKKGASWKNAESYKETGYSNFDRVDFLEDGDDLKIRFTPTPAMRKAAGQKAIALTIRNYRETTPQKILYDLYGHGDSSISLSDSYPLGRNFEFGLKKFWKSRGLRLGSVKPLLRPAASASSLSPASGEGGQLYEQQDVGPARTAPRQAKGSGQPRTKEELDRLGREVEEKMIAAGRDVEEAKAMGLLASQFAHRFAERTGTEAKDALNIEFRRGKAQEKQGTQGKGYTQPLARQSEEYDPGDPKTWPEGPERDEALALEAWQNLENDDEVETWPESPEKTEALALEKEYDKIAAWIENLSSEEFTRRLQNDDPEFTQKNERGVELEKELRALRKGLLKRAPKNIEKRLSQLIGAEIDAAQEEALAAGEAEEYDQAAYHGSPHRGIKKMSLQHIGTGEGNQVYGYGTYSAETRDVAEKYRKALIGRGQKAVGMLDGQKIDLGLFSQLRDSTEAKTDPVSFALCSAYGDNFDIHHTIERLEWYVEEGRETDLHARPEVVQEALKLLKSGRLQIDAKSMQGQLYRLEVPENDVLLDWDAPLSKQPKKVKAAIRKIAKGLSPEALADLGDDISLLTDPKNTGGEFYQTLASLYDIGDEKGASMLLLKHGVPGLRYLDGDSRNKGDGTHNFVVWDENAMSIEETYYQRHGLLTFKLTGEPVSKEYMAALEKLEGGEPVTAEEYDAIPEIQDARGRTATGSTLDAPNREAIRKQVYDKLMSYGSAVTEIVDGREQTVYNGEVRNDRRADIIIGLPASGKSSALVDPISSKYKSMLIDSDEAKKLIPEFDDGFGAGLVHAESKDIVGRVYDDVTDEGKNVVIPIVGSSYAKLKDEYINDLHQKGYKVYVHMADINPNVAAGRNLRRFAETGRFVDLAATSFKYGNKPREVFERIKKEGIADGYSRIDTTVFPGKQVEGTEDISHDRGDLREGRRSVLGGSATEKGRESGQTGTAGGVRRVAERAGGTSRMGTAPRSVPVPNGRTYFLPDGTSVIEFFETANKSTSFHEFGHHVFNKMVEFSGREGVDPQMAKDVETVLKEARVSRESFDADVKNARRRAHEFFARGFEKYLAEGKAPTKTLRDVFRRIHNWMIEVYERIANIPGKQLSDEMRGVYDRLFASDGAFGDVYGAEDVKAGTNAPAQTQEMVTTTTRKGVEVDTKVRDTSNDTRMMDLFNSPNVVAERHAKFRPFFGMAKEAVEKQERMRSNWNKAVDAIYGGKGRRGLLSREQVPLFNETLLEGDALGRVFTADELRGRGFDDGMVRAYRLVRGLYDNAHRMLSAQRNKYGKEDVAYREGYVPHFFHAWRVLEDGKIVTSYRSMNEAVKAAEKMKAEDESRKIRVAPALDDFGGRGKLDAVTLGDMQYFKLAGNVEKAMDLSPEEARGLLEGAARMKGRSRVFKNAWERKGVAGFDTNMEYALRHYLNLSARYIAMDTLKHDGINLFERTFGRFDNDHKGLARYTKDYINDVLGVPSNVEQTLNNWVRNSWLGKYLPNVIGDRPATVAASSIASLVAHCKLGFLNVASAAMNLSQLNGTQAIIGPTWTARGLAEYLHPNQMTLRLYADAGVEENITAENPSGYSKVHQARGLLADTSMMAFRLVDGMARKVTLIGAYRKALKEGKSRAAAIEYAKQVNDDVNFDYSVADAPNFIRRTGPIGTLLFQFKKFPVKMLELALPGVGKLKGMEQVRFWAPMVVLSGVFGLPGFDLLKDWLKSIFGKDLELETKKLIAESPLPEPVKRTILYGALSNLGIDVGRRAGMGDFFPSEMKDLTGPAAATIGRVVESLPKIFDDGNFMDTIEALSPGLANPIKAVMGETRDRRRDRVAFRYETMGERVARATGARPIREAIENDAVRIARYDQQKRSAAEADAIDDFIRAREDSDVRALDRARDRLRELRITPDRIRAEMVRRRAPGGGESTAYERALKGVRTPRRIEDYRAMENYTAMWD